MLAWDHNPTRTSARVDRTQMSDRCRNCQAGLGREVTRLNWEAICPHCEKLTWLCAGDIVICCVTRIHRFGVFVELGDHVEGLIHISELSEPIVDHPAEIVSVGSTFKARVLRVDMEAKKIGLSRKRADPRQGTGCPVPRPT